MRGSTIRDVTCGTGGHIRRLRGAFDVMGVDIDPYVLEIAREKDPGVEPRTADMRELDLGRP